MTLHDRRVHSNGDGLHSRFHGVGAPRFCWFVVCRKRRGVENVIGGDNCRHLVNWFSETGWLLVFFLLTSFFARWVSLEITKKGDEFSQVTHFDQSSFGTLWTGPPVVPLYFLFQVEVFFCWFRRNIGFLSILFHSFSDEQLLERKFDRGNIGQAGEFQPADNNMKRNGMK